jgi:hypothetical protein
MAVVEGPRTYAEAIAWIKAHPTKHQGGPWAGVPAGRSWCEQLMNNAGLFGTDAYESAALAGNASGGLDPRPETSKQGDFVYWTNHVGLVTRPGWMICASTMFPGSGVGEVSFTEYSRRFPAQHWRGHSPRHGNHILKKAVPAAPAEVKPPTVIKPPPVTPSPPLPPTKFGYDLLQGQVMWPNDYLVNGSYRLTVGANSILVEMRYDAAGRKLIWATSAAQAAKVGNHAKTYAVLQPDGNFVLYGFDKKGKRFALWNSRTTGGKYAKPGERVILQPNGHLYVQPASGIGKTIVKAR